MACGLIELNPASCLINDISTEFEIQCNFKVLLFKTYMANHNANWHTSQQLHCRDMCKILLLSVVHIVNQSTLNFYSIKIQLAGWAPSVVLTYCPQYA